ncbi:hypothetical protein [Pseudomonas viridiflava]|uniref:hypothetical protein n=1 Tax=Pseudomonas viridiflava TaxID=33069 RepID=UPI000F04BDEC|nr:hypothetical protein [Pseudomonas viridiflava]
MKKFTQRAALSLALFTLNGCDWVGIFAKEAAVAATSHRGRDTFTFKGQLPAEFGIDAIAFYGPNEPGKASCQTPSFEPGKTITRRYSKQYTAEIQAQPQAFSFEIPLSYYKGLCGMRLGRVKLEINGRYGPQEWQQAYGQGNFYIGPNNTSTTVDTDKHGTINITAACTWLFQQSKARSILDEIEKRVTCQGAGARLSYKQLANKTITLTIKTSQDEKPSMRNRWITTDSGWKPCQETETSNRCQSPPTFKTFKMNGHTCTVYPGCTE